MTPEKNQRYNAKYPERVKANRDRQNAAYREKVGLNPGLPHGLTREQYDALVDSQGNKCATCMRVEADVWCIDHDHSCCLGATGCPKCVRGILCKPCNTTLGYVSDNGDTIKQLISYLESPPAQSFFALSRLGLN